VDAPLWIFAYGSLIWRPGFDFEERAAGFVEGWSRRFWQGSVDHRGVPAAPGRVVTLAAEPRARCWGVAYPVSARARDLVLARLAHRESGGFDRLDLEVRFGTPDRAPVTAITYVAPPGNPNYLGPASIAAIAEQVRRCHGPSGSNLEYALRLAEALEALGLEDDHVFERAARL